MFDAVKIKNEDETSLWKSYPMSNGFVEGNQWYENTFSISLPNDIIRDSDFNCYVLNDKGESFIIDDFSLNIKCFSLPTYIDEVEKYDLPKDLKNIFNTKSINILYSSLDQFESHWSLYSFDSKTTSFILSLLSRISMLFLTSS